MGENRNVERTSSVVCGETYKMSSFSHLPHKISRKVKIEYQCVYAHGFFQFELKVPSLEAGLPQTRELETQRPGGLLVQPHTQVAGMVQVLYKHYT